MPYDEYVNYLLKKYGPAKYDYFCNEKCKSKNSKNSRSSEGLFCHHIDENKEILLSTPEIARSRSFAYQKSNRLVYANYMEHLLLHIKIVQEDTEQEGLGLGGVIMISSAINDYFRHGRADGWKGHAMVHVKENYNDYIIIMKHFKDFADRDKNLKVLLASPVLAQGWYGRINYKVHRDLYSHSPDKEVHWSNSNLLKYFENQHKTY
jgi:hypothetical protein